MAELEKVINALGRCESYGYCNDEQCPYYKYAGCLEILRNDALTLLKAQELVEQRYIDGKRNHFIMCGNCNTDLIRGMKYCSYCGKAVKWDG